ncbi:LemA family protein [Burkholderia cepacia]|uniref:LemA family protein n=1 Tax=Burkholderia cepacia TaxID=292 RepID=UPI00158D1F4A|nr:LemA family protein [Burkholderia cepacia]
MKTLSVALIALALAPTNGSLSLLRDGDTKVALALNGVVGTYDERAAIVADLLQVESRGMKAPDPQLAAARNAYATVAATPAAAASLRQGDTLRYYDDAQFKLEIAVSRLLAVSDSDRKMLADKRYRALKVRLRSIELRIGMAREQYDNAVAVYNARLHTFRRASRGVCWAFMKIGRIPISLPTRRCREACSRPAHAATRGFDTCPAQMASEAPLETHPRRSDSDQGLEPQSSDINDPEAATP